MNDHELDRLALAGNAMRPDWPTASLRTFLGKHFAARAYRDVALVLANVCTIEPRTDTPQLMLQPGVWGITAAVGTRSDAERHPSFVPLAEQCATCSCDDRTCAARQAAGTSDPHTFETRHDRAVRVARAEREAARPQPKWSPSQRSYLPAHHKQALLAGIEEGRRATSLREAALLSEAAASVALDPDGGTFTADDLPPTTDNTTDNESEATA